MKITTLIENTACREDLTAEHGLSLYIETDTHKILFDAGQTDQFADNAKNLGIDLQSVDFALLSHGHYDHSGGFQRFRSCNPTAPLYINRYAFQPHFNSMGKDIGVSPELPALPGLVFTQGEHRLADHMRLYTLDTPPADTAGMTVLKSGQHIPEDFRHEQYLMIEENGKRILFSGCSHKGIVNIASHFEPDILIGGFHLMNVTDEDLLSQVADTLLQLPTTYYTGHCTGGPQYTFLKQRMGDRLHAISTGSVITL